MNTRHLLPVLALLASAACDGNGTDPVDTARKTPSGNLLFVSGVHGKVNVLVDGAPVATNVALGGAVGLTLSLTQHTVNIQKVGGAPAVGWLVTLSGTTTALMVGTDV